MEEEESSLIISGDVENIIIKLEPSENFLNDDDETSMQEAFNLQINEVEDTTEKSEFYPNENFVTSETNVSNVVQIPFHLENYFANNDNTNSNNFPIDLQQLACSFCKIIFPSEKLLHEHLIVHIDIHKMGCNVCDKDLNVAEKYQLHIMAITRQSIYFCDLCKKSCAGVVRSKDQSRPEGKAYACHDCEIQVTGKACILSASIQNFLQKRKISNCNQVLQSSNKKDGNLQIEFKLNGPKFNPNVFFHRCQLCDAFFAQSVSLTRHLRVTHNFTKSKFNYFRNSVLTTEITNTDKFKCPDCKMVFSDDQELVKHSKQEHENDKPADSINKESLDSEVSSQNKFTCNQSDVSCSENVNVTKDLHQKHKRRKQKFTCKLCLKQFRLQRRYNSHVNFHGSDKNYVCCSCELTFLSKYKLQQHMKIHNLKEKKKTVEKKKYKCEKKTLSDVSQKRNLRRTRLRNS